MALLRVLTESIIWLVIVAPIILTYRKRDTTSRRLLVLFFVFYLVNHILLHLPRYYDELDFVGGRWNWTGKLLSIAGSTLFYLLFRKYFRENDFVTVRQKEGSLRTVSLVTLGMLLVWSIGFFFGKTVAFNIETLAFQLTMPGFDEEFAYRGIALGLLVSALSDQITIGKWNIGNPAVWITATLFGLAHGVHLTKDWHAQVDWNILWGTFLFGWILAWMTLKSRSILIPIVLHNLSNTIGYLIMMLK